MTLDKIVQEVLKQGQTEANSIHKAAGKESLLILDKATKEVNALNEKAKSQVSEEAGHISKKIMSSAELETRKRILQTKAEVLDRVKSEVLKRLQDLPIVDRERYIKKLLAKARTIIPEGTVSVRTKDQDLLKSNIGGYRIGEPVDIAGGMIVESKDRKMVLDLSFETLFEETWERNFAKISQDLFGEVRT